MSQALQIFKTVLTPARGEPATLS